MNKLLLSLLSIIAFFVIAVPAYAMTARGGQAVYVPKGEVVNGTLFAGGNSVTIDGVVHGDVFCGSQSVVISGTVDGDVICAGQSIRISGVVAGSIRAAGQNIEIAGPVQRNVTVVGQALSIDSTGSVGGEVLSAAQRAFIDAKVGGDVNLAVESLAFGDHANIAGSVKYESKTAATLAPSATIAGTLTKSFPKETEKTPVTEVRKMARGGSLLGKILFYFVLAVIISLIAPKRTKRILGLMQTSAGAMILTGLISIIIVPVIILTMAITLIGIPFALLLALIFAFGLLTAEVFTSISVGRYILDRFNANRQDKMFINILVGVPAACLVFAIPIIGGLASFLGAIWGLGAMIASRKASTVKRK